MNAKKRSSAIISAAMEAGWKDCIDSIRNNPTFDNSQGLSVETWEFLRMVWGHGFACGGEFEQDCQKEG